MLEALARIRVKDAGGERSVLERVQYMSSVSGGSLATGYFAALTSRPQAVGYGLTDSPAGLAARYSSATNCP